MSKIFYDRLIVLDDVDSEIKAIAKSHEERDELWQLVDEMVHHRVLGTILDKLPSGNHDEFLERFGKAPYDESILDFLKEKIGENIEELLKQELGGLAFELLEEIRGKK